MTQRTRHSLSLGPCVSMPCLSPFLLPGRWCHVCLPPYGSLSSWGSTPQSFLTWRLEGSCLFSSLNLPRAAADLSAWFRFNKLPLFSSSEPLLRKIHSGTVFEHNSKGLGSLKYQQGPQVKNLWLAESFSFAVLFGSSLLFASLRC